MRAKHGLWNWAAVTLGILGCARAKADAPSGLTAEQPRCEYLRDPLSVEETSPRLSWIVTSPRRAEAQSAYRVLVASSVEGLARDEGDLWDSGRVASSETAHVVYGGRALVSRQVCFWKVRAWNRDGEMGPWSVPARWEMGLLDPSDWSAKWVEARRTPVEITIRSAMYQSVDGKTSKDVTDVVARLVVEKQGEIRASNAALGGDPARDLVKRLRVKYLCNGTPMEAEAPENSTLKLPWDGVPYLRKSFRVEKKIAKARLYATALGVYELSLNGERIGDERLAPGWTDYPTRLRYQVYDVTEQIGAGENVLGAIVAPGWFSGHAGLFNAHHYYGSVPALLAQLEITYADGGVERIISDDTWKAHPGPLLMADLQKGETYDAGAAMAGWDTVRSDESGWTGATVREEHRNLRAEIGEPVRATGEITPKSISEPSPGHWTFDLGQNMVGVVCLRLPAGAARRGTVITLRHAEVLNPDGTIYTANLRGAASTDTYICAGDGPETWQPRFTFHGFRYVELTGLDGKPPLDALMGVVIGSDLPAAGEFSCSDPRLNQLQSNIRWGLRGNYLSVPTDCPQRDERMGWMADAQVFAPTAAYNADVAAFMSKWMIDVDDAQRADGAYADVSPVMKGLSYGAPAWADAGVIVPWVVYQAYGDKRILERHIGAMTHWVEWCRDNSTGLIRDHARGNDYGDWLSINADTPKDLIGTAYFARSTDLLARSLRALGRDAEALKYERLRAEIKGAFIARYVDAQGRVGGGKSTQCAQAIALEFDLLPENLRARAAEHLEEDIKAKDWHLSTGFVGVSHLLRALSDNGKPATAYRLLMQDSFPSWLFSVKYGATTIWERWDGWTPETGVHPDAGMNSFNHYSLGSCGRWLFESVAGIALDPDHPGFSHIIVRPLPTTTLSSAKATYKSIRGLVASAWSVDNGEYSLNVTIPANTGATVYIPSTRREDVLESGKPFDAAEGVRFVRQDAGATVLEVGSGVYAFAVRRADPPAGSGR